MSAGPKSSRYFGAPWSRWALERGAELELSSLARHLLSALTVYFDERGDAWPSYPELVRVTGRSRSRVGDGLKELKDRGAIESTGSRGTGSSALFSALESGPQDSSERQSSDQRDAMESRQPDAMESRPQDAMESRPQDTEVPPEDPLEETPLSLNGNAARRAIEGEGEQAEFDPRNLVTLRRVP